MNKPLCYIADPSWNGILRLVSIFYFLGLEYNLLTISVEFPLGHRLFFDSKGKIDGRGKDGLALTLVPIRRTACASYGQLCLFSLLEMETLFISHPPRYIELVEIFAKNVMNSDFHDF